MRKIKADRVRQLVPRRIPCLVLNFVMHVPMQRGEEGVREGQGGGKGEGGVGASREGGGGTGT